MTDDRTVYVNDDALTDTEVYHDRASHATNRRFANRHTRETTPKEAVAEGLRPCQVCDPPTPTRYSDHPIGYPFPDDDLIYCSAFSDFDPDANSYIAVARLPDSHTVEINGKEHTNTHRLVIHSPTRGPEAFMVNPQADKHALLSAVLNIMAEDNPDGIASGNPEFYERKSGVKIDFTGGGSA